MAKLVVRVALIILLLMLVCSPQATAAPTEGGVTCEGGYYCSGSFEQPCSSGYSWSPTFQVCLRWIRCRWIESDCSVETDTCPGVYFPDVCYWEYTSEGDLMPEVSNQWEGRGCGAY